MTYKFRQRGATLVVSLILLVMITMLALSTMRTSTMEERMSRFSREQSLAFQAAESALKDAEIEFSPNGGERSGLINKGLGFVPDCEASGTGSPDRRFRGLCQMATSGDPAWKSVDWAKATSYGTFRRVAGVAPTPLPSDGSPNSVAQQPRYIVEYWPMAQEIGTGSLQFMRYRITAQGFGPNVDVQSWVQSILVRQ
ncbi:PilX N-terminal domain-containing pilus assembly protein [Niveibacterium sp.]|uniref:pilus assembly PilX family protein n=1 Tax=Niveibacterium sp. TaxID=2017444 RepID=UPI0035B26FA5